MPGIDGLTPLEKWHGVKFTNFNHLRRLHPWGCPTYVLDARLQDGKIFLNGHHVVGRGSLLVFSESMHPILVLSLILLLSVFLPSSMQFLMITSRLCVVLSLLTLIGIFS